MPAGGAFWASAADPAKSTIRTPEITPRIARFMRPSLTDPIARCIATNMARILPLGVPRRIADLAREYRRPTGPLSTRASRPSTRACAPRPAAAPEAILPPVLVTAPPALSSSSEQLIPGKDFELRPQGRPADVLRLIPGLIINQHQGGGKAEQYLIRGFDADHGTDLALFVDALPVNLRSHAHGQGYADLHFLIPETVRVAEVLKGPYFPEYGDF